MWYYFIRCCCFCYIVLKDGVAVPVFGVTVSVVGVAVSVFGVAVSVVGVTIPVFGVAFSVVLLFFDNKI